jgi:hypothetical protein
MRPNVIKEKSFQFAVNTMNICKSIQEKNHEFILTKQLDRIITCHLLYYRK